MRKFIQILTFSFLSVATLSAQIYQEISTGAGYNQQAYINLSTDQQTLVDNASWDIAFDISSQQTAGVFMNESAGLIQGQSAPRLMVYDAKVSSFSNTPIVDTFTKYELLNKELSWKNDGAFNVLRSASNPFDFGWGTYNPAQQSVQGTKVFVIEKRNGTYLKFMITLLTGEGYTFTYANLDGSNTVTKSFKKADYAGKPLVYYSFDSEKFIPAYPNYRLDLIYQRYVTQLFDVSTNTYINYTLTGILNGPGVKAARIMTLDQEGAKYATYKDSLKTELDVIGHDWKFFSGTGWEVPADRVYFVKTSDGKVFKFFFIDFEGSSTGTAVLQKEVINTTAVSDDLGGLQSIAVYPNPANHQFNLILDSKQNSDVALTISSLNGQQIWSRNFETPAGFNAVSQSTEELPNGIYLLKAQVGTYTFTQKLVVQH